MNRRMFMTLLLSTPFFSKATQLNSKNFILRKVPSSGEKIPAIGMGTWQTFNVGSSQNLRNQRLEVLRTFFAMGGGLIDSSPMYGSAQEVVGYCLQKLNYPKSLISADKIWTYSTDEGKEQFEEMKKLWGLNKFDLVQVHNLLNWKEHLNSLRELKEKGEIKYIGITTSHGRRHDDFESILKTEKIDFIQLTYNLDDRLAEKRLLPLAQDKGIAIIANRPFDGGNIFARVKNSPLPEWAAEIDCNYWSQIFLKFIISHPAITLAIPATSKVEHMKENMGACYGKLPDAQLRKKIIKDFERIS